MPSALLAEHSSKDGVSTVRYPMFLFLRVVVPVKMLKISAIVREANLWKVGRQKLQKSRALSVLAVSLSQRMKYLISREAI